MSTRYKPVYKKIKKSRTEVLLFILSIIQGLAFTKLLSATYDILSCLTDSTEILIIISHALLCCIIIIRLFETLFLGLMDYSEAVSTMYEVLMIFIVGAIEYWLIDSLDEFKEHVFYLRLAVLSGLSFIGYMVAIIKISKKKNRQRIFKTFSSFRRELYLQSINLFVIILILLIAVLVINGQLNESWQLLISAITISLFVVLNIYTSWHLTITNPKISIEWKDKTINIKEKQNQKSRSIKDYRIEKARYCDSWQIANLYLTLFPYVFKNTFLGSDRTIVKILLRVIVVFKGKSYWGYDNVLLVKTKKSKEVAGFIVFAPKKELNKLKIGMMAIYLFLVIVYHTGIRGASFFLKSLKSNKNAAPDISENELYVSYIGVTAPHSRKGIARALLAHAEKAAVNQKLTHIGLDVRDDNTAAKTLFLDSGFKIKKTFEDHAFGQGRRLYMRKKV